MKTFALILLIILFSNKAYPQYEDGWKWVNPYPNGMDINYIQFFNLNTGYSLIGEFLKTSNSGLNWKHGADTTNFYPYFFINMNTGWRFTWNEVQKTTNAGENWNRTSYRNPYVSASKVIFIDSLYGMSSGTNINPLGSDADISWTTNGGLNWSNITFFDVNYMHTIDIVNPSLAIALGSNYSNFFVLYKTTNFGQSWDTIRPNLTFGATKLKILDSTTFIAGSSRYLYKTEDGGKEWFEILNDTSFSLGAMNFWDSSTGIILKRNGIILRTTNGGTNWAETNTGYPYDFSGIEILNDGHGIVSGDYGTILKTTNKGLTWISDAYNTTLNDLNEVERIAENTLIAVGYGGTILKSTNKGTNWINVNSGTAKNLFTLDFFKDLKGYSAGDNIMMKTIDGGTTWLEIPYPVTNRVNDIECLNDITIFAGCTNGFLINSTNGGNNWATTIIQHDQSSPNIYEIYFLNTNTGFLGTSGSKIFKTTNGGLNWENKFSLVSASYISSIEFINDNTGYAASSSGRLYTSTDGGNNWALLEDLTNTDLNEIKFVNDSVGYIAGDGFYHDGGPFIFKTTDGGLNWDLNVIRTLTGNTFESLEFIDDSTCVAVGSEGTIIKTTSNWNPVNISPISSLIPETYSLNQNYPNPFNPSTLIKFNIPTKGLTKLVIYDLLGRVITQLVNQYLSPGTYEIQWNAANQPSGVYFYRLQTEGFSQTKRMVLIK